MSRYELITLLEATKRRYCEAIIAHRMEAVIIAAHEIEYIKTKIYSLNIELGIKMNSELNHV